MLKFIDKNTLINYIKNKYILLNDTEPINENQIIKIYDRIIIKKKMRKKQMAKTYIIFDKNHVQYFGYDFGLYDSGTRVSYIVPNNILLRLLFFIIRKPFKNNSKIAKWTRSWKCKWKIIFTIPELEEKYKDKFISNNRLLLIHIEKTIIYKYLLNK